MLDPPAGEHDDVGIGMRGDEPGDVAERIERAGEPEQDDAGAAYECRIEWHRPEAFAETGRLRVPREGTLRGERILVNADAGGPGIRCPQCQRAVLIADHDDRALRGGGACCSGLVQDQAVRGVGGEQVGTFDVGPASKRVGGVGRHPDSLAQDAGERCIRRRIELAAHTALG